MALSVKQLYEVMAQLPDPVFILSEDGYYIEYIGGVEQQSYQDGNPLTGKRLADVLPAAMTRWVMEQVTLALDSGQVQVVEYELAAVEVEDRRLGRAAGDAALRGQDCAAALPLRWQAGGGLGDPQHHPPVRAAAAARCRAKPTS